MALREEKMLFMRQAVNSVFVVHDLLLLLIAQHQPRSCLFRACFIFQLHLQVLGYLFTDTFATLSWLHGDVTIKRLVTKITFCIAALWLFLNSKILLHEGFELEDSESHHKCGWNFCAFSNCSSARGWV